MARRDLALENYSRARDQKKLCLLRAEQQPQQNNATSRAPPQNGRAGPAPKDTSDTRVKKGNWSLRV